MKKVILALPLLVSQLSFAADKIRTVQAIHYSAPGLTLRHIAVGTGEIEGRNGSEPCTLLYKNEVNGVDLTLIVGNNVAELRLDGELASYDQGKDYEEDSLVVDFNKEKGVFSYVHDYGSMTDQYEGAHSYSIKFEKKSENSFAVSYFHGWADDDGMSGEESYKCLLKTEK